MTGTAVLRPGDPPREGVVEFTDERRTVALPIRTALPILTKAHALDDLHPSVRLLTSSALLGLRLVAAGRIEAGGLALAGRRAGHRGRGAGPVAGQGRAGRRARPSGRCSTRSPTRCRGRPPPATKPAPSTSFQERLARRLAPRPDDRDLPQLVRISLRVEADEEELVAGAVRLVLQVHDEQDPLHLCDAAVLWTESGPEATHGFGDRARTHAAIALRSAAEAWPVLDRLAELRVPDQITLDTDELVSLLHVRGGRAGGVPASTSCGRAASVATSPRRRCSTAPRPPRATTRWRPGCSGPTRCSGSSGRSRCTASR